MENEVERFAKAIGAVGWRPEGHVRLFSRKNYFQIERTNLIIKISRSNRPFWGVGGEQLAILDGLGLYYLILLISEREGWAFSREEIAHQIAREHWRTASDKNEYKVNYPLPDANAFSSPEKFLIKLRS